MTTLTLADDAILDLIDRDAYGVEFAHVGDLRVHAAYHPMFVVGKRGQKTIGGLSAGWGCVGAEGEVAIASLEADVAATCAKAAAVLAIRNFGHSGTEDLDLYLPHMLASAWSAEDLDAGVRQGRDDLDLLARPRRIFLEASPAGPRALAPTHNPYRRALANEGPDDRLDERLAQIWPEAVRIEANWLASCAGHDATRKLLATLSGNLKRRGVKLLFDGLDTLDLVDFASDCGADWMQGAAIAAPKLAGERIDSSHTFGATIINVDFARQRRMTVA